VRFELRVLEGAQTVHTWTMEAASEQEARRQAAQRGLQVMSIRERGPTLWRPRNRSYSVLLFSQEIKALLEAGLTLVEGLEALRDKATSSQRQMLEQLVAALRDGSSLSHAMGRTPDHFPPLLIGLVSAAEGNGDLANAFDRYLAYRGTLDAVRSRVASALVYPAILLIAGSVITVFLLGYVVPRFSVVYQTTGRELPAMSAALLAWGRLVASHAMPLAASACTLLVAGTLALRSYTRARGWAAIIDQLPGLRDKRQRHEQARLYFTLGTLLQSGFAIVPALTLLAQVTSPSTKLMLASVTESVRTGHPLSDALDSCQMTSSVSLRLLQVGERSGKLGEMLLRAARLHDDEVARSLDRFSRVFEPALMAVIGLIVGTIVVLLYMPIFDLAGSIQ
jgi:general secretion pathway protein F